MSSSSLEVKKFSLQSLAVMLALGALSLALAPTAGHYRGFYLCLALGGITALSSAASLAIVALKKPTGNPDAKGIARLAMEGLWVCTSMGLGFLVTAPAPYFSLKPAVAAALFAVGLLMLAFGWYALSKLSKKTGLPLSI